MTKKNFLSGIDALLKKTGRISKTSESKKVRTSIVLDNDLLKSFRAIAFWERSTLKDVIKNAMQHYLSQFDSSKLDEALIAYQASQDKQ